MKNKSLFVKFEDLFLRFFIHVSDPPLPALYHQSWRPVSGGKNFISPFFISVAVLHKPQTPDDLNSSSVWSL